MNIYNLTILKIRYKAREEKPSIGAAYREDTDKCVEILSRNLKYKLPPSTPTKRSSEKISFTPITKMGNNISNSMNNSHILQLDSLNIYTK
jgi:hypothetical protein